MHAESGLMFPVLQSFTHHLSQPADENLLCSFHTELPYDVPHMGNMMQTSNILEYDLGAEGVLFEAPAPILEEPELALDPLSAAMTIISNGQDIANETIQNVHLNNVLYDCKNELLAQYLINEQCPEANDVKIPVTGIEQALNLEGIRSDGQGNLQKSLSTGCLNSVEMVGGCNMRPNFLDFQAMDFETAFGLRRAYSEGDIQALESSATNLGNTSNAHVCLERQPTIGELRTEDRQQKLSRYWKKKSKRNFGRKIKYECRKALADNQPRVRGRFAKTEDCDISKLLK
ncbi:uncharacterized protein A4U43_C01F5190 [Asparagus officinalis]|uniref:CCT domain-containing protein n=1 Tax=Asparagus officinalis TaxID=4686 RepID=A0A5P1FMH3_ASPOF|nr:uncharacterized protein LOC109848889 [Asparagus officinalis]ONK79322.1 uncharacterized protein A4U43_C01F5190 [Asparagus officinalis]